MNWHNEVHEEMGWFEELRQRKIDRGDLCGGCGEWPEFCCCTIQSTPCKASISGLCLAITHNLPFCEPTCDKMDGEQQEERSV